MYENKTSKKPNFYWIMGNYIFRCCSSANLSTDHNTENERMVLLLHKQFVIKTQEETNGKKCKSSLNLLKEKNIFEKYQKALVEEWYLIAEENHLLSHPGISLHPFQSEKSAAQKLSAGVETTQSLELMFHEINASTECNSFYTCSAHESLEIVEIPDFLQHDCEKRRKELDNKGLL